MEQYLNYTLMIKNQNILATLMIFLNELKTVMKSFIEIRQTSKTTIAELFSKTSNKNKISNKQFHHCKANIFLQKVTKSINSQKNMKSLGNDSLTANFINTFQMNYLLRFINNVLSNNAYVYQSWENFGTMGVSYRTGVISATYKKGDKEDFANYRPISLIFRYNNISISKY